MGATELLVASLVVFAGAAIQGSVGFGLGLFTAPILIFVEPRLVPSPVLVLGFVFTLLAALRPSGTQPSTLP